MRCLPARRTRPLLAIAAAALAISACDGEGPTVPDGLFSSAEARQQGAALFARHCTGCHGQRGNGRGARREGMSPPPADLTLPPWSRNENAPRIYRAIRNGVAGTAMPGWPTLTDDEVWSLVAYVHSL